jgi:hypothetical protein
MQAYLLYGDAHRGNWDQRIASKPQEITDARTQQISLEATKAGHVSIGLINGSEDEPIFMHEVGPVSAGAVVTSDVPVARLFAMDFMPDHATVEIHYPREERREQLSGCIGIRNALIYTAMVTLAIVGVYWLGVGF